MNSVYIHIPFCKNICSYCDFCKLLYNEKFVNDYLKSLELEVRDRYHDEQIKTIYIGGGSPSSLNINELNKLFNIIKLFNLNNNYEFTFECNLNDITENMIKILYKNKVNRISIGIESFNKDKLLFMERFSDFKDTEAKINMIRNVGINNINLDLMYGIPGETLKILKQDLNNILKLKPDHISTYSLILEEKTKLNLKNIHPIDEELELEMYNYIRNKLRKKKYQHYEISNFALSNKESIHNLNYWNNEEYYGFGLGSHGFIDGFRYENTKNLEKYIKGEYIEKQHIIGLKENEENELILGLRKIKGINIEKFYDKFKINIQEAFPIKPLIKNKDLIYSNGFIYINPDKIYIMNEILLKLI